MPDLVTAPTVISVDPGGTTGWSIMVVHPEALCDPEVPILTNIEHWSSGQIKTDTDDGEFKCVNSLVRMIENWAGAVVNIEDFILRRASKGREMLSPVRITAALEYALMEMNGNLAVHLTRQQPSLAMTTATDERLKSWGLYTRTGAQQHARDADRHNITILRRLKDKPTMRGTMFPHLYKLNGALKTR